MRRSLARVRLHKPGLLARFTVLSLLAVLILGIVVGQVIRAQIRERALEGAGQSADLISRFGIQPQLSGADLSKPLAPEAVDALDHLLHSGATTKPVISISVLNPQGRVVYSSEHGLIG